MLGESQEPIVCPKCGLVRARGPSCPSCGHEAKKRTRTVVQLDGSLEEHERDIYKPRRVREFNNTESIWVRCYHRALRSRNGMTFRQAEGLFFYENHYYPPRTLRFMPVNEMDWFSRVCDVPPERLVS